MAAVTETIPWDFERLSDTVSCHRRPAKQDRGDDPSLIVLCTWMSANRKHIAKYTQQHRKQYPDAEVLVIESSVADIIYRPNHTQQERLRPARDILFSHISSQTQDDQRKVLLHVFSNGGAQCALQLVTGLPDDLRLAAFTAVVFDSCPGEATYQQSVRAMILSLPKTAWAKYFGIPLIHIMLCLFYLSFLVPGSENVVSQSRKQLNDPGLFSPLVPRLYIYSKADQLVLYEDVKTHVDDAKQKGYLAVSELLFEASGHCAHAMTHKDEYWKTIDGIVKGTEPQ